jgi:hypothetical protein
MSKIQPAKAVAPVENATAASPFEIDLKRIDCSCGCSDIKLITRLFKFRGSDGVYREPQKSTKGTK